jgi:acetylornithine/succinyldiaminopimelate/putrescine aminotransferase
MQSWGGRRATASAANDLFGIEALRGTRNYSPLDVVLARGEGVWVWDTAGKRYLDCRGASRDLVDARLLESAAVQGARFKQQLQSIRSPAIRALRGRGLVFDIDLDPHAGGARLYCERLRASGLLAKDIDQHTIRIVLPRVIDEDRIDWACETLADVIR